MPSFHLAGGTVVAGDFRIVRPLSEGGMGAVFVAEQLSTGSLRALKVMHAGLVEDPQLRRRFEQEARASARIKSEHVVQVVAAGVDPTLELPYLAMELLEGEDCASLLARRERLSPQETWAIFVQLGHAVGAAHAAGIVHRDLKPENIFLAESRREGELFTLKVLDFGIAKVAAEANLTTTAALGTPLWMAPEQTEHGGTVTPATDVWALGLLAFRFLTGKSYWRGAHAENRSAAALLREIVLEPLPPASERASVYGVVELVPPGFDAWFARCVVRDPAARFRDAFEARAALATVLGGVVPSDRTTRTSTPEVPRSGRDATQAETAPTVRLSTPALGAIEHEPDGPTSEKPAGVGSAGWAKIAVAAVVVAVGAAAAFAWRDVRSSAPASAAPSSSASALGRCPGGMVAVSGGTLVRGADSFRIDPFCVDVSEVTVEEYGACAASGRCLRALGGVDWPGIGDDERRKWSPFCNADRAGRQTHPMNCVLASQAATYCKAQGKRLPSEPEWQWAAQDASRARLYPWGTTAPEAQLCWSGQTDRVAQAMGTCPVASFPAGDTASGVHDLAGNVAEWTLTEISAETGELVVRGGAWSDDEAEVMRAAHRDRRWPMTRSSTIGFRCAWPPL